MNCVMCGTKMKKKKLRPYHYTECNLRNVWLVGVDAFECPNKECSDEGVIIPQLESLHDAIASHVASQEQKLLPEEIRFLRTHLGFSGIDFARYISVSPETVSRWENGSLKISETSERFLRVLVLARKGPFRNYEDLSRFANQERKTSHKTTFKLIQSHWKETKAA